MAMLRGKRGPYKLYLQDPSRAIPKQTLSNWRKKEGCDRDEDPSQVPQPMDTDDLGLTDICEQVHSEPDVFESAEERGGEVNGEVEGLSPALDSSGYATDSANDESVTDTHASDLRLEAIRQTTRSPPQNLLYPGAQISEATGTLISSKTQDALTDVLQLLRLHMPADSIPPAYKSVHRLYHASSLRSQAQVVHTLCSDCGELVNETLMDSCNGGNCMHSDFIKYYELPLDAQIQALFKGANSNITITVALMIIMIMHNFQGTANSCHFYKGDLATPRMDVGEIYGMEVHIFLSNLQESSSVCQQTSPF